MRISICLRGERAASMHFVRGARDSRREGLCIEKPLSLRQISRIVCDGGLSGCGSRHLSGLEKRNSRLQVQLQRDFAPSSSCPTNQDDARGAGPSVTLGQGS